MYVLAYLCIKCLRISYVYYDVDMCVLLYLTLFVRDGFVYVISVCIYVCMQGNPSIP